MKVAIVGRPNVGKSSLFNALTKTRDAIVLGRPGTTRDVVEGARGGVTFLDTAGLENEKEGIAKDATDFAIGAAAHADAVLFVVDALQGLTPMDMDWARKIKRNSETGIRKPNNESRIPNSESRIILVANKCESKRGGGNLAEFYKLGLGAPLPVSAEHNIGIDAIMNQIGNRNSEFVIREAAESKLPPAAAGRRIPNSEFRIAIMGQPNVGKSTLVNRILGEKRVLVRDEPGITRDVVRARTRFMGREIEIVDTAGLRRKSRVADDVETLAALKSIGALDKTDAVILVVDAEREVERQAVQIAERIFDAGKVLCVALNKWDLIDEGAREERLAEMKRLFKDGFSQIIKPLVVPISAESGAGVANMMKKVFALWDLSNVQAKTSLVNRAVEKLVREKAPPMSRLKRPMKIKFAAHTGKHPNVISINVGGASDIPDSYTRYLRRGIAERMGWESIPVVVQYTKAENPFQV